MKRVRFIRRIIHPINLAEWVRALPAKSQVMDVGCGNHSPTRYKTMNPVFFLTRGHSEDLKTIGIVQKPAFTHS
jgi:hypothetical protein